MGILPHCVITTIYLNHCSNNTLEEKPQYKLNTNGASKNVVLKKILTSAHNKITDASLLVSYLTNHPRQTSKTFLAL